MIYNTVHCSIGACSKSPLTDSAFLPCHSLIFWRCKSLMTQVLCGFPLCRDEQAPLLFICPQLSSGVSAEARLHSAGLLQASRIPLETGTGEGPRAPVTPSHRRPHHKQRSDKQDRRLAWPEKCQINPLSVIIITYEVKLTRYHFQLPVFELFIICVTDLSVVTGDLSVLKWLLSKDKLRSRRTPSFRVLSFWWLLSGVFLLRKHLDFQHFSWLMLCKTDLLWEDSKYDACRANER